ncbi:hypothetical protein AWH62_02255 [Maricaulis sp. W15]|uniref:DODA-type extradiol aromatic ring-opening family dioxygenase n=1 Tax=Maricaulis sp. W15 TaxID=1772333 RepID=UPI0009491FCE|nr:class III extradiol ring-cleavage dioxygenase [Maricaulis sp. W15]OLF81515.1 hypothetical protein AWH62_02255 [Maricaulis sp. W15]
MLIDPLFISHGAPDVLVRDTPAHHALASLTLTPGTRAVLVVSAHWEADPVRVQTAPAPSTIHDFSGFGPELARAVYDAPGAPDLAAAVIERLKAAGLAAGAEPQRGRDHGAWIPLALMHPDARIPVFQVSLPASDDAAIALGKALAPLSRDRVQIIGSGALTHALGAALPAAEDAPAHPDALAFADWIRPRLASGDTDTIAGWRSAPAARFNHPTPEHFRPLLVAMAAGGGQAGTCLHKSWSRSALAMDIWRFAA